MQAIIVGIKKVDFKRDKDGEHVKMTRYFLTYPSENVEGQEVDIVSWDEVKKKKEPPNYCVGEVIDVEYNKYGKLTLVEPLTATSGKGA